MSVFNQPKVKPTPRGVIRAEEYAAELENYANMLKLMADADKPPTSEQLARKKQDIEGGRLAYVILQKYLGS